MNGTMNSHSELEERLKVLEKMILYQLDKAKKSILNGETGYQKIKSGPIVEVRRKVNIIRCCNGSLNNPNKVNNCCYFGYDADENLYELLQKTMNSVLENVNIGEHEGTEMFIQWSKYTLIRFDVYCYRCNFSSNKVVKDFEGAIGVIIIKRIIDLIVSDPQILVSTIFQQVIMMGYQKKIADIINEVVTIINTIGTTTNKLESIMPTSCIQNIDNTCRFCCTLLPYYSYYYLLLGRQ